MLTPDRLYDAIRQILLSDWDPNDAARRAGTETVYDSYIEPLATMINSDANEEAIVDYLFDREREIMCFPGLGKQRLRRVAQKLLALKQS